MDGELERHRKFRSAVGMSIAMMCFMLTLAIPLFGDGRLKPVRIVALIGLGLALSVHIREAIKNRPH